MNWKIMIFILIAALIIIAGHAFLYITFVKFFLIHKTTAKLTLAIVLGILSVSFIITTVLIHALENPITDVLYIGAATWLGALWYVALACVIIWIVFLISRIAGVPLPLRSISAVFLFAAMGLSIFSIANAYAIRTTRMTVRLPNIPESWKGKKAVQLSDVHLGAVNGSRFMKKIVALTNAENPDLIFVTGDLFDGGGSDIGTLALPINDMRAPMGKYFITGNHEQYQGLKKSLDAVSGVDMRLLFGDLVDVSGVIIAGFPYEDTPNTEKIQATLSDRDLSKPLIVLYHVPTHIDLFRNAGVNLLLSGHSHKGQMWPFAWITKKVFNGYDYGLHVEGDFSQYTSSGVGTWGPPMRSGNNPEVVVITFE